MSGIQISGLASGINWTTSSMSSSRRTASGVNQVKAQQTTVNNQITALASLGTDLTNLSNAIYTLEDPRPTAG